jgi:hypothetical protein
MKSASCTRFHVDDNPLPALLSRLKVIQIQNDPSSPSDLYGIRKAWNDEWNMDNTFISMR